MNRRAFLGAALASGAALHPALAIVCARPPRGVMPVGPTEVPAASNDRTGALIQRAREALERLGPRIAHRDVMAVADFSAPSQQPRLYLVDLVGGDTQTMLVAHGKGSDPGNTGWVERFSNQAGSNASCSGSFLTGEIYSGKHGRSRKLIGLDPQNDAAESRGIVIHSASYVSAEMAREQGRIGRSQGCFAVSEADLGHLLAQLGPGRLLYAGKA